MQGLLEGNRMVRDKPGPAPRRGRRAPSSGRATRRRRSWPSVHLSNLPENLRVLLGRDRRGRQLRRHLPVGGARLRQRPDQGSARCRAASSRPEALQAIEKSGLFKEQTDRDRADPQRRRRLGRRRSAAQQGHPLPVRAELRDARHVEPGQHQEPRGDQALLQVSPGLDAAAARPRRQRARSRSSANRAARRYVRTQALRAMELSKNRAGEIRTAAHRQVQHRRQAPRHRRPRLGRAGGHRLGAEPPRRSAVVHDRVSFRCSSAPAARCTECRCD